jgi:hypothetical protein
MRVPVIFQLECISCEKCNTRPPPEEEEISAGFNCRGREEGKSGKRKMELKQKILVKRGNEG